MQTTPKLQRPPSHVHYNIAMNPGKQTSLIDKVQSSILELEPGALSAPLVLMVSGGSDSVALLCLVHRIAIDAWGNADNLLVAHVNHQLRGPEALADEAFVLSLCEELGIECQVESTAVAALAARSQQSVEQIGRTVRYDFARKLLADFSLRRNQRHQGFILTAHTANDRAETLLQRLIVGAGTGSLASIPWSNDRILRPLLDCSRQELRDWLTAQNLAVNGCLWREDATNLDTTYSRAFVRHELIPLLAKRNPRIVEGLNRTAELLSAEDAWLDEQAAQLLPLWRDSFSAPLPLLRRAIYLACNAAIQELAPAARITFEHVELIARAGSEDGFACQIPGGIEVRNIKGELVFKKAKPPQHDPRKTGS